MIGTVSLRLIGIVIFLLPGSGLQLFAEAPMFNEYEVKSAFLYNFAKFIEWPSSKGPLVIGVLGKDPFGSYLDRLQRQMVRDRSIVVKRFKKLHQIGRCHILFISPSEKDDIEEILQALNGRNILTVSSIDGFVERGGMINFRVDQNRVRFEINQSSVERGGLKISSQLLKLARIPFLSP